MQRTLIFIPHEIAGLPVFGFGWMLIAVAVALTLRLVWARRSGQSVGSVLGTEGFMWALVIAGAIFVLPKVELHNLDGEPVGMAIRGYGVMLLAGVSAAVALAAYRAKSRGIHPEVIGSMAPWAFIGGIIGARLFYVIQYREKFIGSNLVETIGNMLSFTEGGLVVYGSFIGGFIAVAYFIIKHKLPLLKLGDVIVPCLFIGVFFGRIGCLMNGCCYGGRCEDGWLALQFPAGSAVYSDQLATGELLGMKFDPVSREITEVTPGSLVHNAGVTAGSRVEEIADDLSQLNLVSRDIPTEEVRLGVITTIDGRRYRWTADELPPRALPVRGAQIISSVSSLLLCLGLCSLSVFRFREGTVMMLGFASYAILRFVLELVRVDEGGQFGTELSISQWVSIVVLTLSIGGLVWIYSRGARPPVSSEVVPAS